MEAADEVHVVVPPSYDKLQDVVAPIVAKGKRTKRQRLPLPLTITTTNDNNQNNRLSRSSSAAAANSSEEESTTTEEEDTARCLILLARGGNFQTQPLNNANDEDDDDDHRYDYYSKQNNSPKRPRAAGGGACMYACKTCDRVFPSFQALGGHRASHKKPRNKKIKTIIFLSDEEEYIHQSQKTLPPTCLSLQLSNISSADAAAKTFPSPRIHECSYCGAEFASGQALGGHMRRHRPVLSLMTSSNRAAAAVASAEEPESEEWRKRRNGLSLDLNLPAPEKLVLSTVASATLVDCHF